MRFSALVVTFPLACILGAAPADAAIVPGFDFAEPMPLSQSVTGSDGFRFTPTHNVWVSELGYYDAGQDGLALAHAVAIFDYATQVQLAFASVTASGTLRGSFRYETIAPVLLSSGTSYLVAGYHPGSTTQDFAAFIPTSTVTISPLIAYQGYTYVYGGTTVQFPTTPYANFMFFGPNLRIEAAPEAETFALTGLGLVVLALVRRTRPPARLKRS